MKVLRFAVLSVLVRAEAQAATCESLLTLSLPHTTVTLAQPVAAGAFSPLAQPLSAIDVPMLLRSSNWSDSRQRLQSGLCLGFANSLPLAVGAMVFEVCQIGVLRREQPLFLLLGLRP